MFLDLYQRDQDAARQIAPNEGRDLPATFSDTFEAAMAEGLLFSQSVAGQSARWAAISDQVAAIERRTGLSIAPEMQMVRPDPSGDSMLLDPLEEANRVIAKRRAEHPDLDLPDLTPEVVDQAAIEKSRQARQDYAAMSQREKTLGGSLGTVAGSLLGAASDPVNLIALPLAPADGIGILATALRWGGIAAVSQTAIETANSRFREQVQPGYFESGAPLLNIGEAFGGGAALGGVQKGLGALWTRAKVGEWPRSVRDAGNIVESEANIADTNVYPGAAGEVAHREALAKTIDDLMADRPVNVTDEITPDLAGAWDTHIAALNGEREGVLSAEAEAKAARQAASTETAPALPFEPTAQEATAEARLGRLAAGIGDLSRRAGYLMPRDEAQGLATKIAKMPDDQARQALQELAIRPRTLADTLPKPEKAPKTPTDIVPDEVTQAAAKELSPEAVQRMAADPDLDETVLRDLDRLRAEKGDVEIPMGEVGQDGQFQYKPRKVEDVLAEADAREAAAREIELCAGPQKEAAE